MILRQIVLFLFMTVRIFFDIICNREPSKNAQAILLDILINLPKLIS